MEEVGEALAGLDKQINDEATERKKELGALKTELDETTEKKLVALEAKIKDLTASAAAAAAAAAPAAAEDSGVKAAAGIAERAAVSAATASAAAEDAKADVAALMEKFEKLRGDHEALISTEKENAKQDAMMAERFNNLVKDVERIEKEGKEAGSVVRP